MGKVNPGGKYPYLASWCCIQREKDSDRIVVRDCLLDLRYQVTKREAMYLSKLDGNRDPYHVPGFSEEEAGELLEGLSQFFLRRPGRTFRIGWYWLITLYIPARKTARTIVPKVWNLLLLFSFLPIVILGWVSFYRALFEADYDISYLLVPGIVFGIVLGMILHELSHAFSCLAYGGRWMEAGLMVEGILPGAYVLIDTEKVKSRMAKVQINLAGIEMNLLISGVTLLAISNPLWYHSALLRFSGFFFGIALQNLFLAILNMSFFPGLDGESTMSMLLGTPSMVAGALENLALFFKPKKMKAFLHEQGASGAVRICCSITVLLCQLSLPLLIVMDVLSVLGVVS